MDNIECCICLEKDNKDLVMLKCFNKHIVCFDCCRKLKKCPLCREDVSHELYEKEKEIEIIEVPKIEYVQVPKIEYVTKYVKVGGRRSSRRKHKYDVVQSPIFPPLPIQKIGYSFDAMHSICKF